MNPLFVQRVRRALRRAVVHGELFGVGWTVDADGERRQLSAMGRAWHFAETGDTIVAGILLEITDAARTDYQGGCRADGQAYAERTATS